MIVAIPDDYHGLVSQLECLARLAAHEVRIFPDAAPAFERLVTNLSDAQVIVPIRERTRFTRELIERLPRLKHLSQTGRSVHHIDIAACTERGIVVTTGSHASPHTVAEHTWALILAALRRLPEETALMKQGKWRASFSTGLHGRTLGILGLGKIGALVARVAPGFGMKVLVWGREASLAAANQAGYRAAKNLSELFEQSDVVCLCARLSKDTRGIVTADDLARMKPDALLVNTARAGLIAPGVLELALERGYPGMAAVDVYDDEPVLNGDHPLLKLDNALCTAHSAWLDKETYELYFGEAFDNVLARAAGAPVNVANPEVLERR